MAHVNVERLHELLVLDHKSGMLFWKAQANKSIQWNSKFAGRAAGCLLESGYVVVRVDGRLYRAHHVVWAMTKGVWPKNTLDHKDGVRHRNQVDNLREASTHSEQAQNLKLLSNNTSGYTGVSYNKLMCRWEAYISINKCRHRLGFFNAPELARDAYREAKKKLHLFQPKVREA